MTTVIVLLNLTAGLGLVGVALLLVAGAVAFGTIAGVAARVLRMAKESNHG